MRERERAFGRIGEEGVKERELAVGGGSDEKLKLEWEEKCT